MVGIERISQRGAVAILKQHGRGLLAGLVAVVVPLMVLAAPRSGVVAVIGSPNAGAAELAGIVAAAGGTVLSVGGRQNIMIAQADGGGFAGRLYGAGARLVVDGSRAPACGRALQSARAASRPDSMSEIPAR